MAVVAMAQFLISFNLAALPMTIGPMVKTFDTSPTTAGTTIIIYSLSIAALIMLGARVGQIFGSKRVFQIASVMFGLAMAMMAFSPSATIMVAAQGLAGVAAAALVPSLVVLIATSYKGEQQARALGLMGSAKAFAGLTGFLVAGLLGTLFDWRYTFALLIPLAVGISLLGSKLKPVEHQPGVTIDVVGVELIVTSIVLLSLGFNNLTRWGLVLATVDAPFSPLGLSPAPIMIVFGILFGQAFLAWEKRRQAVGKTPLLALEVIRSRQERAAVYAMFIIVALGACINFLVPLYIMIVQGRSSLQTGISMMPYNLTILFATMLVVRFYELLTPRRIARYAFVIVAVGLSWLAFVIRNDWSTLPVILGLVLVGIGQGALVTLLFNVLVATSPRELAGDVGSLRGATNSLANAAGTAMAAALVVSLLNAIVLHNLVENPVIPPELKGQVDLDNITFISNDRLLEVLQRTTATPEQVAEAVRINTEARLQALKIMFVLLAGLALLAVFPVGSLPNHVFGNPAAGRRKSSGVTDPLN